MSGWVQLLVLVVVLAARIGRSATTWRGSSRPDALASCRTVDLPVPPASIRPRAALDRVRDAPGVLVLSVVLLYIFQRVQGGLPLSLGFGGVHPDQAFNTAASFPTNTNWQSYSGESTMGHLSQMGGLAVQNFVSAAVGHGRRGRAGPRLHPRGVRDRRQLLVDMVRATVRILLPIAFVFALVFVSQGVVQNLHGFQTVHTVTGARRRSRAGRSRRRSRSRSSATTAEASTTPTPRTRSRTRARSRTSSRCSSSW